LKEKYVLSMLLLASLLLMASFSLVSTGKGHGVIRVPANYPTIQEAVNAAAPGSIILVDSGTYLEHLVLNKTLKLVGQDKANTTIDGGGNGTAITVVADDVLIDGFTIRNAELGVHLYESHNSTISGNIVTSNWGGGVLSENSTGNIIIDNIMTQNGWCIPGALYVGGAIDLWNSSNNFICGNILTNNTVFGLSLRPANYNLIYNNVIINEYTGIELFYYSAENIIHHNNFVNNYENVHLWESGNNIWDDGVEGNYWDSYDGLDDGSGSRVAGDGVGDTDLPYLGVDNYPLIAPYGSISIVWENNAYPVTLLSNSTVSTFRFIQADKKITFTLRGPLDTIGYCNITILLNLANITLQATITENQTHITIHFTNYFGYTPYNIEIIGTWVIPEYLSYLILTLFLTATLLTAIIHKRKK